METIIKYKYGILKGLITASLIGLGIFLKDLFFKDEPVKTH